jgi:hypothetical protein
MREESFLIIETQSPEDYHEGPEGDRGDPGWSAEVSKRKLVVPAVGA